MEEGSFGVIKSMWGHYDEDSPDWIPGWWMLTTGVIVVLNNDDFVWPYLFAGAMFAAKYDKLKVPYDPIQKNSNAWVYNWVKDMKSFNGRTEMPVPRPLYKASIPGWDVNF
jgi:hypothetical protein